MKNLIEVALHKATRESGLEDFDFTKSALGNSFPYVTKKPVMSDPKNMLPIKAEKGSWNTITTHYGDALTKTYNFNLIEHLLYFVEEVVKHSEHIQHHPKIEITNKQVYIELTTHDIGIVSDLDIKLSKFCDEIFEDIYYIEEF